MTERGFSEDDERAATRVKRCSPLYLTCPPLQLLLIYLRSLAEVPGEIA